MSLSRKQRLAAEELAKRRLTSQKVDIDAQAFDKQRAFLADPSKRVAAVCSRRAGKTFGVGLKCIREAARHRYSDVIYITLARPQAKRNFWPILHELNRDLRLDLKFNNADLTAKLPASGSTIWLGGANDVREIQRYRGMKSPLVVLDEAQDFRGFLEYFIEEILEPVTLDMGGQILLTGTPNASCFGFFHDVTTGEVPGWKTHHWTVLDNPKIKEKYNVDPKEFLEEKAGRLKQGWDDPKFRREYRGEWVRDNEGLIFAVNEDLNVIDEPFPTQDASYILGIDVGYKDATAFVVLRYSIQKGSVTVMESFEKTKLIPSTMAVEIEKLSRKYDFEEIVVDPGGGGKFIIEEMIQRYGFGATVAQKAAKISAIELLNGDLRNGSMKIIRGTNEGLLEAMFVARWEESRAKKHVIHVDGNYVPIEALAPANNVPDHLTDALLYGYRSCRAYLRDDEREAPQPGSQEAFDAEEEALFKRREAIVLAEEEEKLEEEQFLYGTASSLEALFGEN
jgi:peroxiredoxin family protein